MKVASHSALEYRLVIIQQGPKILRRIEKFTHKNQHTKHAKNQYVFPRDSN